MIPPPEIIRVSHRRVACDGSSPGKDGIPAALGHPRVFLEIDDGGSADCGYCDRRFVLAGHAEADSMPGDVEAPDEDDVGR